MLSRFLLGAIVGGIAVYVWGDGSAAPRQHQGPDRARWWRPIRSSRSSPPPRSIFDSAKDQVTSTLQVGSGRGPAHANPRERR